MSEIIYWVGDLVRIKEDAFFFNGEPIPSRLKGDNFRWYVTEVDSPNDCITLGAFLSFGGKCMWASPITIHTSDVTMIKKTCRHLNQQIDPAKLPTCLDYGITEGKHCNDCGEILIPQHGIEPLGHKMEYDIDTGIKICTRCRHTEQDKDSIIDFTSKDIRTLIKIIEGMLNYDSSSAVPPLVDLDGEPFSETIAYFSKDIKFDIYKVSETENVWSEGRWSDDLSREEEFKWTFDGNMDFLLYTPKPVAPRTSVRDGTIPLIVFLHGEDGVSLSREDFVSSVSMPKLMRNISENSTFEGFYSYVLCPRMLTGTWEDHKDSFFSMIDSVVKNYHVDTSKIIIMGESIGGTGVEFFTYQKPEYFSCQIIMNGYSSGVDIEKMKELDFPTRIFADNESYSAHFANMKNVFDGDLEEGETPTCKVFKSDDARPIFEKVLSIKASGDNISEERAIPDILYWALEQNNDSAEPFDFDGYTTPDPKDLNVELPKEVYVTQNAVAFRSGPSIIFGKIDGYNSAYAGQRMKVDKVAFDGEDPWGKIADGIWNSNVDTQSECVADSERWIPIKYTDLLRTSQDKYESPKYVTPFCYNSILRTFSNEPDSDSNYPAMEFSALCGTPVYSAFKGKVESVVMNDTILGNYIVIKDGSLKACFGYLSDIEEFSAGDTVDSGVLIGHSGCSEDSPKLYFQLLENDQPVDPRVDPWKLFFDDNNDTGKD